MTIPHRQPVEFDPSVSGLPTTNAAPYFLTYPVETASAGQTYRYQAQAFDANNDPLSYLLVRGPTGLSVDVASGVVVWQSTADGHSQEPVVIQVYDSAGAYATQSFVVRVDNVNRPPQLAEVLGEIGGFEGETIKIRVQATDPEGDSLVYWADHLPPGAAFDSKTRLFSWTPDYQAAGTYEGVEFLVSDGRNTVVHSTTLIVAHAASPPLFTRPANVTGREGEPIRAQLHATDVNGRELTYSSDLLPPGAALDPVTGLFSWTPDFTQHGIHLVPLTVSNGEATATQTLGIAVLNVNGVPVFQNLDAYELREGQFTQILAQATDPDNAQYVPPYRDAEGSLEQIESGVATVTYVATGLPAGDIRPRNTASGVDAGIRRGRRLSRHHYGDRRRRWNRRPFDGDAHHDAQRRQRESRRN